MNYRTWLGVLVLVISGLACTHHEIETKGSTYHKVETTHEVKPIHIIIDINIKVDRELDDFFGDLDKQAAEM